MAKRLDKSSKGRGERTATAKARKTKTTKALSVSEVIMTMTAKDAEKFRTIFWNARSRRTQSRVKG